MNVIILGAGIAGISAGYHLKKKQIDSIIYEKDSAWREEHPAGTLSADFKLGEYTLADKISSS